MKFDILFSTIAMRDVEFFGNIAACLQKNGYKVGFITFHEACEEIARSRGFECFNIHRLADQKKIIFQPSMAKELEERYGLENIRQIYIHDRLTLNRQDEQALLHKAFTYFSVLEDLWQEHDITCVVQELGGFIAQQTLFYSSQKHGVQHLAIEPSMYAGRILLTINSLIASFSKSASKEDYKNSQDCRNRYLASKAVNIPQKDRHHFSDMTLSKIFNRTNFEKLVRKLKHKYISKQREEFDAIGEVVKHQFAKLFRRMVLTKFYTSPSNDEAYVYFPLHVPHDIQLYVRSPEYKNQEALIEYISRSLPYGMKLYVKEHPASIGAHPLCAIWQFLKEKNVRLIHPQCNSYDLIKNAKCVVTINSKVGVEALMQNKPVVVLGEAFYRGQGVTYDVSCLKDLSSRIYAALQQPPSIEKISHFMASAFAASSSGELYVNSDENIAVFTGSLLESLTPCLNEK